MIKVIKFGGTIINHEKYQKNIMKIINQELKDKNKIIIVVSAIGRKGEPYSTYSLNKLGEHLKDKDKAELLSYGERLSAFVFFNYLLENNYQAMLLRFDELGILLNGDYLNGNLLSLNNEILKEKIKIYDIVIVPGFIGSNKENEVILLGKGGSDLTAIYVAEMLNINNIDLYKDVSGVMSGDPKIIADPLTLEYLDYDECLTFAKCGASIIQEKAILEAKKAHIIINVCSINTLEKKSEIGNKSSNLKIKGIMSYNDSIFIIGNIKMLDCNEIYQLLKFYNFRCEDSFKNKDYLELKLQEGKRNFAMNILHHHFISNKIK